MLFVGYFEGIDSQRKIAWRYADSMSVRGFLGSGTTDRSPHHSILGVIRNRLPMEVLEYVLKMARKRNLIQGRTIAVDSTFLEANAAMKSIVRRTTGEDRMASVKRLAEEPGDRERDRGGCAAIRPGTEDASLEPGLGLHHRSVQ